MPLEASRQEIFEKFAQIVAKSLHIDVATVREDSYLDDLGAESLDLIEITMETEEAFDTWIPEKTILETAREVFGPDVLEKNGFLTEEGKALLRHRLPDLDPALMAGEIAVRDLNKLFLRVGSWVRMIESLLTQGPKTCPDCGGPLRKAVAFKRKCEKCEREVPLASGEDLNRQWVLDYRDRFFVPDRKQETGPVTSASAGS